MNFEKQQKKETGNYTAEISKASTKDVNGILNVQSVVWPLLYADKKENISEKDVLESMSPDGMETRMLWERVIREEKDTGGDNLTLVAKDENKIVGFGYAVKDNSLGEIRSIYVLPQYQNSGIGSKLLSKLIEWLGKKNDITLSVSKNAEHAIAFYKRFGFQTTNRISFQELNGDKKIPEIEMRLSRLELETTK